MVAYKKLSELNGGGVGSIFEIFEYTTDGTPYSKPKISSGYAIIKSAGELIYRTTSSKEDVKGMWAIYVEHLPSPRHRHGPRERRRTIRICGPVTELQLSPLRLRQGPHTLQAGRIFL